MSSNTSSFVIAVSRVLAWLAGLLLLASALIVSIDVITRGLVSLTFLQSFELSSYAFAAAVTLGLAYTLISRTHIRIEVIYVLLKPRLRAVLDLLAISTMAVTAIALAWFSFQTVWYSWSINSHSNTTLAVPLALPQGIWLLGIIWFAFTAVWLTVRSIRHLIRGQYRLLASEIGVLALQDELDQSDIPLADVAQEDSDGREGGSSLPGS
ncbi:TRAP transporter small permease subunit [Castellaniella sp.]|uniref:TRAP transporter small permease subunit n=1 Tax=Castellaniella sp. TaxID=1955812 RepID=UPI0035621F10